MKQFKSLVTRDISLNRWILLMPVIAVVASYLFLFFINLKWGIDPQNISYALHTVKVPFIGLIAVVVGNIILCGILLALTVLVFMTPNALNDNIKNHCEIFYKCLPVAPWKIVVSKVVSTILIPVIIVLSLAFLNTLIAYLVLEHANSISLGAFLNLTFSLLIISLPYILFFGSFFILLSALIKKNVLGRVFVFYLGTNIMINIFRAVTGIKINTLGEYVRMWLANPSFSGKKLITLEVLGTGFMSKISLDSGVNEISRLIVRGAFSWDGFCLLIVSAILLTGSAYAYKLRKLD